MRKNLLRKMIVIFSVMPLLFVAYSASPSSNWDIVREGRITHIASMVGFLNESYGITVGARGSIYFTNSGGEAWAPAENKSLCLFGIELIDESTAIYCGNGGYVGWVPSALLFYNSRFPSTFLRTVRTSFPVYGSPVTHTKKKSLFLILMDFIMTVLT